MTINFDTAVFVAAAHDTVIAEGVAEIAESTVGIMRDKEHVAFLTATMKADWEKFVRDVKETPRTFACSWCWHGRCDDDRFSCTSDDEALDYAFSQCGLTRPRIA